jgi:hypothetical protein
MIFHIGNRSFFDLRCLLKSLDGQVKSFNHAVKGFRIVSRILFGTRILFLFFFAGLLGI